MRSVNTLWEVVSEVKQTNFEIFSVLANEIGNPSMNMNDEFIV